MDTLQWRAFEAWCEHSDEGLLVVDSSGKVCLMNARLQALLKIDQVPESAAELLSQTEGSMPELRILLDQSNRLDQAQWGSLRVQKYPPQRLGWRQVPLTENDDVVGSIIVFQDASAQGQLEIAKQSFLSMISHDLRTPLSTILGFAELLDNNRGKLSDEEQREFLGHIIKNANQLSRYTQIALDIMYLEADLQSFEIQPVFLDRFVRHWLTDAVHRFPADRLLFHNGAPGDPMTQIAPAALHKILYILVEFALTESPPDMPVGIHLNYDAVRAHVTIQHKAPDLSAADAALLFRLMHPRDLSEMGRPHLHRMQLYVASLLAERQQGALTLHGKENHEYHIDLALPLMTAASA
ncbi:MAG: hypothetical protein JXQ72_10430 [Anaerolineae bacterium]|nr:hypothetical protein [Anaerolineae bacterium]